MVIDVHKDKTSFQLSTRIVLYVVIMLIGVILRKYVTHSITIVWIVNLIGLFVLFIQYIRYVKPNLAGYLFIYVIFGILTIIVNLNYLTSSIKSLGTNVNLLIFPIMLNIAVSDRTHDEFSLEAIESSLKFVSVLGLIAVAFTWITDYQDIIKVFNGTSAYKVEVAGFFYSKNIYGAFISLTLAADLYLLSNEKCKMACFIGIKLLAVILSFSRAALLQAGVMLFVFYWVKKKTLRDYFIMIVIAVTVVAGIVYVTNNERLYSFVYHSVLRVSSGDAGREFLRNQAIERVGNNLVGSIFGVGFAGLDALDIDVDNTYLYIWFTGGIIKLIFYVIAMITSLKIIFSIKTFYENIYRICLAVFISYLFFAYFESVSILELGLLNYLFTLYMFMIPFSCWAKVTSNYEQS